MKYLALILLLLATAGCTSNTNANATMAGRGVTVEVIAEHWTSPRGYDYALVKIYGNGVVTYQLVK